MSDAAPRIDHVLVNVHDQLDHAEAFHRGLGFNLMPRGHHSVGSSNHLAIFETDYFELLGYEPPNAERASGLWGVIAGFSGLILKTDDAPALAATFREKSIPMVTDEPRALSRMVDLPDGTVREARFSSLHLDPSVTPGGMILYCQHLTPELVWRPEWQSHPNGVRRISAIAIASNDPAQSIALMERIHGRSFTTPIDGGLRLAARNAVIDYLTPDAATARFGDDIALAPDGSDRKVAITFATASIEAARDVVAASGVPHRESGAGNVIVPASAAFGAALVFVDRKRVIS